MDEKDTSPPDSDLNGMAGALARALALRNTVMQQSGKFRVCLRHVTVT